MNKCATSKIESQVTATANLEFGELTGSLGATVAIQIKAACPVTRREFAGLVALATIILSLAVGTTPSTDPAWGAWTGHEYQSQLTEAPLGEPLGAASALAVDSSGDVWVFDPRKDVIDKFEPSGGFACQVTGVLGRKGEIHSIAVAPSSGYLYVAEAEKDVVDVFEPSCGLHEKWTGGEVPGKGNFGTQSERLIGVAVDASTGSVYVDNSNRNVVYKLSSTGHYESQVKPVPGLEPNLPNMAVLNNDLYLMNGEYSPSGAILHPFDGSETPAGSFLFEPEVESPFKILNISSIAVDSAGNAYIVDSRHKAIDEFGASGRYIGQIGGGETPTHHFVNPIGVSVAPNGDVYVSDFNPSESSEGVVDIFGPAVSQNALVVSVSGGATTLLGDGKNPGVLSSPPGVEETLPCRPSVTNPCPGYSEYVNKIRNCEGRCSSQFAPDTTITLTETSSRGFKFKEWGNGCSGAKTTCEVKLSSENIEVTAEFEEVPKFLLTVSKTGSGTVVSEPLPSGIECGTKCSGEFEENQMVTLRGGPEQGWEFKKWGNGCSGSAPTCTVTMTAATEVTAEFVEIPQRTLTISETGDGTGAIGSEPAGIECLAPPCAHSFSTGTLVTLTEVPSPTSHFVKWSGGGCSGSEPTCKVEMTANVEVTAEFEAIPQEALTVVKTGGGAGTVTSSTGAIDCGGVCAHAFNAGAVVTLTASPSTTATSASTFAGWSGGGCSGVGSCEVTMNVATEVTAEFEAIAPGVCPNEAVRAESNVDSSTGKPYSTELPECRAYELVTPPYKQGSRVFSHFFSADGSRVIVTSFGDFGEAGNSPSTTGTTYELSRGPTGWSYAGLNPSAAQFPFGEYLDATPELSTTLWYLRSASQSVYAADLYLREADGALHDLGPIQPPSATAGPSGTGRPVETNLRILDGFGYLGASQDLSHVLFGIDSAFEGDKVKPLWPEDTTATGEAFGYFSLYEYIEGRSGPPLLVGVNDADELIGQCGVGADGISADGSMVFFTPTGADENKGQCKGKQPPVGELYARIGNGESGAHTVNLSEPPTEECRACNTSTRKDATYQGASEDGSKVFFTTEQELLPGHRGVNLYEYDFGAPEGEKVGVVSAGAIEPEFKGVVKISSDGSRVYFLAGAVLTTEPNGLGVQARPHEDNLYVYDTESGRTAFVATLSSSESPRAAATPDGRFLVFENDAPHLTPDDASAVSQVFRYDADTGQLLRVSIGQEGFGDNGNAGVFGAFLNSVTLTTVAQEGLAISADGSNVAFKSVDGLTPRALNDVEIGAGKYAENAYLWHDGQLSLISDGRDETFVAQGSSVTMLGTTASGADVFFTTSDPLVAQDTDTEQDIYDARVEGGLPAPAPPPSCSGDACQGSPGSPFVFGAPASTAVSGGGNMAAPAPVPLLPTKKKPPAKKESLRCAKGKRTSHGRCVKKPGRKRAKGQGRKAVIRKRTRQADPRRRIGD